MDKNKIIISINEKLKEFGVDDCQVNLDASALVLNIEKEDKIPEYKIAVTPTSEEAIYIYCAFAHGLTEAKDIRRLFAVCNEFNGESFLKFSLTKKFIKISYTIPEFIDDIEYVVRVITVIPNLIAEFYEDMLTKVDKIRG